jgi:hypothetical protein
LHNLFSHLCTQKIPYPTCPNFPNSSSQNKSVNGRINGVNGKRNRQ